MKTYKSRCPQLTIELKRNEIKKAQIKSSKDAADFFREIWDDGIDVYESFFCIYLNRMNNTIGFIKISQGGLTGTVADPRLVMKGALDCLATSLILCHNHPSGNLSPSEADKTLTMKIKSAAMLFDINVVDHIIIVPGTEYFSFLDDGVL